MADQTYRQQVALLLDVLPEVAKEQCFALHGGTAINLFVRDMPRVSIDIDLTYTPIEERALSLQNIQSALERIKVNIEKAMPNANVQHLAKESKLLVVKEQSIIKLEVNTIIRGSLTPPQVFILCKRAQEEFQAFCEISVVSFGQLFGGKICAALDRQHPRDIFDVRFQLDQEGLTDEIKTGFLFCLLSSNRPMHELLQPNLLDQRQTLKNQFQGMTIAPFTYEHYEKTRKDLISIIRTSLTAGDKEFLMSFFDNEPNWSIYDFRKFPSIRWKMQNLSALKSTLPGKYEEQQELLRRSLEI